MQAQSALLAAQPFSSTSFIRLQALYSDFSRQRSSNPAAFQANVEWWRKAFELVVSAGLQSSRGGDSANNSSGDTTSGGSRLVLHASRDLIDRFKVDRVGKPIALGAVVAELRASKTLLPLSDFLNSEASIYYPGWLPTRIVSYVIGRPLWWTLEQAGVVGEEGFLTSNSNNRHKDTSWWGDYVVVPLVERAANAVINKERGIITGPADRIYSWQGFRATFSECCLSGKYHTPKDADIKVLVKYLERDRQVVVVDKDVIKFVESDASLDDRLITAVDRSILELKDAVVNLRSQVKNLQDKVEMCTQKASLALQQKQKSFALSYLRSRKQLQDLVEKRLGSLTTLESTLLAVETAAGDIEIVRAYESSTTTLRAILAHPSLQRDAIETTMDALADANADAQEIDEAVRISGDAALRVGNNIDDDDIEAELRALVEEVEEAKTGGTKNANDLQRRLEGTDMKAPATIIDIATKRTTKEPVILPQ